MAQESDDGRISRLRAQVEKLMNARDFGGAKDGKPSPPAELIFPLSEELIEQILGDWGQKSRRTSDGKVFVRFDDQDIIELVGGELNIWLSVEGNNRNTLRIQCTVDQKIPISKWPDALLLCNNFHLQSRIGRAILVINEKPEAELYLESQTVLEEIDEKLIGITKGLLQSAILSYFPAARQLFEMAYKDGLFSTPDNNHPDGLRPAPLP